MIGAATEKARLPRLKGHCIEFGVVLIDSTIVV